MTRSAHGIEVQDVGMATHRLRGVCRGVPHPLAHLGLALLCLRAPLWWEGVRVCLLGHTTPFMAMVLHEHEGTHQLWFTLAHVERTEFGW